MRGLKNAFFVKGGGGGGGAWWGYLIMEAVDVKEEVFADMTTKKLYYFGFLCLFPSGKAKASKCHQILQMQKEKILRSESIA